MGWKIFGKPKAHDGVSGSYVLLCQETNSGAGLVIDPEATWFLDEHGRRGGMADLEKVIAGTANYDGSLASRVGAADWLLPWGEYPTRDYKAAEMMRASSAERWRLCAMQVEAGVAALFYMHTELSGRFREVLIGRDYTELHLAVQTSDAVQIRVRGYEREVPDRLTDAGSLWRVGLALKRETVRAQGLARLMTKPHIALETSIRETAGLSPSLATEPEQSTPMGTSLKASVEAGIRAGETFKFTRKDYRMSMR